MSLVFPGPLNTPADQVSAEKLTSLEEFFKESAKADKRRNNLSLAIAFIALGATILFSVLDGTGDEQWKTSQETDAKEQIELLKAIKEELSSLREIHEQHRIILENKSTHLQSIDKRLTFIEGEFNN